MYERSKIHPIIQDEIINALYPEIPNTDLNIKFNTFEVHTQENETIIQVCRRHYKKEAPYWIIMLINNLLNPFEVLPVQKIKLLDKENLEKIYAYLRSK